MELKLIISEQCPACIRTRNNLVNFTNAHPHIHLRIESLSDNSKENICIVPALFLNEELICYGEVDACKFAEILNIK